MPRPIPDPDAENLSKTNKAKSGDIRYRRYVWLELDKQRVNDAAQLSTDYLTAEGRRGIDDGVSFPFPPPYMVRLTDCRGDAQPEPRKGRHRTWVVREDI